MLVTREIVVENFQLKFFQLAVVPSEIGEYSRMIAEAAEQFQTRQLVDDLTECAVAVQVGQRVKIEGVIAGSGRSEVIEAGQLADERVDVHFRYPKHFQLWFLDEQQTAEESSDNAIVHVVVDDTRQPVKVGTRRLHRRQFTDKAGHADVLRERGLVTSAEFNVQFL